MNTEIERLKLPRGVWQTLIKNAIPIASRVECTYPDNASVLIQIFDCNNLIAKFSLSFLYGCKGILISHGMLVAHNYRGRGIAKKLKPIKDKIAEDLQVSLILATVRQDNNIEKNVIKDWNHIETFLNRRTGNNVEIHIRKIAAPKREAASC